MANKRIPIDTAPINVMDSWRCYSKIKTNTALNNMKIPQIIVEILLHVEKIPIHNFIWDSPDMRPQL